MSDIETVGFVAACVDARRGCALDLRLHALRSGGYRFDAMGGVVPSVSGTSMSTFVAALREIYGDAWVDAGLDRLDALLGDLR